VNFTMKSIAILLAALVAIVLITSSAYTVDETEQVFITQFGKQVGTPINSDPAQNDAGLHFKMPFVHQVNRIEKRILEWDGPATEMPTRDKLYITVDNFARWRISDPKTYFEKLRDERSALSRLDDIIGSETRNVSPRTTSSKSSAATRTASRCATPCSPRRVRTSTRSRPSNSGVASSTN